MRFAPASSCWRRSSWRRSPFHRCLTASTSTWPRTIPWPRPRRPGIAWIRIDINWSVIEASKGQFTLRRSGPRGQLRRRQRAFRLRLHRQHARLGQRQKREELSRPPTSRTGKISSPAPSSRYKSQGQILGDLERTQPQRYSLPWARTYSSSRYCSRPRRPSAPPIRRRSSSDPN